MAEAAPSPIGAHIARVSGQDTEAVGEHLVDGHGEPVLGQRVGRAVRVVLGRARGDLGLRRAVAGHVDGRLDRVGVHEHRAAGSPFERAAREGGELLVLGDEAGLVEVVDARAVGVEHLLPHGGILVGSGAVGLLDAHRQRHLGIAAADVLHRAVERHRRRRARALDVDDRHPLGEQAFVDELDRADLAADAALTPGVHEAVAEPRGGDVVAVPEPGVGEHAQVGLAGEVLERAVGSPGERASSGCRGSRRRGRLLLALSRSAARRRGGRRGGGPRRPATAPAGGNRGRSGAGSGAGCTPGGT